MAIDSSQYERLASHLREVCSPIEIEKILNNDFSPLRKLIIEELMACDLPGMILDIVFEDLLTQKKKPLLRKEFGKFADFLMSDLSLQLLKYDLSKSIKK